MAWVKFDDKRSVNGKLRKAGFAARGLDEAAICWSAHEEDDGRISVEDLEMLAVMHGCKKVGPIADKLVEVGSLDAAKYWVQLLNSEGIKGVNQLLSTPTQQLNQTPQ